MISALENDPKVGVEKVRESGTAKVIGTGGKAWACRLSMKRRGRNLLTYPASSCFESATAGSCQRLRYAARTSSAMAD